MKNKFLRTLTTLTAAFFLVGGFSMTAYAQSNEPTEEAPAVVETPEPSDPLTPEGNATLVDDIWGGNKQLITVTTKAGNYFYILIDRAAEGENTVHFLNMVDEADLMALTEDGQTNEPETTTVSCTCADKCETGSVNGDCPVCRNNKTACKGTKAEAEPETEAQPEQEKDTGRTKSMLLLFLVTVLAGGGAFYYFKFLKPKNTVKAAPEFADFEFEDEDEETGYDEPEEEADTEEADTTDSGELPADETEDEKGDTL